MSPMSHKVSAFFLTSLALPNANYEMGHHCGLNLLPYFKETPPLKCADRALAYWGLPMYLLIYRSVYGRICNKGCSFTSVQVYCSAEI